MMVADENTTTSFWPVIAPVHQFQIETACPTLAVRIVFAYPFHFGNSGFSAYFFTPNPDIRILSGFFVQVRIGP